MSVVLAILNILNFLIFGNITSLPEKLEPPCSSDGRQTPAKEEGEDVMVLTIYPGSANWFL